MLQRKWRISCQTKKNPLEVFPKITVYKASALLHLKAQITPAVQKLFAKLIMQSSFRCHSPPGGMRSPLIWSW